MHASTIRNRDASDGEHDKHSRYADHPAPSLPNQASALGWAIPSAATVRPPNLVPADGGQKAPISGAGVSVRHLVSSLFLPD